MSRRRGNCSAGWVLFVFLVLEIVSLGLGNLGVGFTGSAGTSWEDNDAEFFRRTSGGN